MNVMPFEVAQIMNPNTRMPQDIKKIIYEDDFFICIYDKLHNDKNDFHYTAWCKKDIRSLLDVEQHHIPNILRMKTSVMQNFNLTDINSEIFIHFPPSYWRLHIHFVARPHIILHRHELYSVDTVIKHLMENNNYYRMNVLINQAKI